MNHYERKQEARRERLLAAAERAEAQSEAAYKRADLREEASGIPFGQPILVGHHSERRHRAAIKRADNAMRASIEEMRKEVGDDLYETASSDRDVRSSLVNEHVDRLSDAEVRQAWVDAGLDERWQGDES